MTVTELAIKRPTLVVVVFGALVALGIFSYTQLKYELLPPISTQTVVISTVYPGASPNEVETSVSKIVEDAVSSLDKISTIHTNSYEGLSMVVIEFLQTADIDVVTQDAQRKVSGIISQLPVSVKTPVISKIAIDEIPVLRIGATSKIASTEFYQFLKDHVQPRISNVPGVGEVTLVGGEEREIEVNLDAQKLKSYSLSIPAVTQIIKASNLDFPTGAIKDNDGQFVVRVAGKIESVDDLRQLVIAKSRSGGNIMLQDVAEVNDSKKEFTTSSRINGVTSVGILVQKQTDANAVDVSKLVRAELIKIEKTYAGSVLKFDVAEDGSQYTVDAADAVKHDLIVAVFLVALVMFLFLHSIRNSLIVMVSIPTSLVSAFLAMYLFGYTLNLMTLLAMSLVIGILVDDSIVVLENIYRHLEMGKDKREAALIGRNEIGFAAVAITMVDVVVFLPLALVSGLIGNIVREYATVIVVSTLLSLFVSFTITPVLASRLGKIEHLTKRTLMGRFALWFEAMFQKLTAEYKIGLEWALHNRMKVLAGTGALFIASLMLPAFGFIGSEFIAQADRGEFTVALEMPPGTTIEQTNFVTLAAERVISKMPEVKKIFANVGVSSEGLLGQTSSNHAEVNVTLVPRDERNRSTDLIGEAIKNEMKKVPGLKVRVNPIGIFGTANETPVQLIVSGNDLDSVFRASDIIADVVKTIPGTADVRLSAENGNPETRVEIDRQKMASLGLTVADVGQTLQIALSGDDDSKFRAGNNEYPIRIELDQFDRSRTAGLGHLTFVNNKGQQIELNQFANIVRSSGPTKLQREDRNAAVTVFSQAVGRPSGTIVQDIQRALAHTTYPADITVRYAGDEKNRADGFASLGYALLAAILFTYMIMVALYNSYVYPFVVLFSIPVAIVGALVALGLTMSSLSIFSILGIIMLVGLVAKNAILLVDRTTHMKESGLPVVEALLEAGETRLRPILMTTLTMIFGMLPIALSGAAGSEWKAGLAWALIGGLTSSMILTLFVVPVVYVNVDALRVSIPAFMRKLVSVLKTQKAEEPEPQRVPGAVAPN
jgi:HAE1 family hydrophobic/amphiphilic exporter-1